VVPLTRCWMSVEGLDVERRPGRIGGTQRGCATSGKCMEFEAVVIPPDQDNPEPVPHNRVT
jgi:hypothetical protein